MGLAFTPRPGGPCHPVHYPSRPLLVLCSPSIPPLVGRHVGAVPTRARGVGG